MKSLFLRLLFVMLVCAAVQVGVEYGVVWGIPLAILAFIVPGVDVATEERPSLTS